MCVYLCTYMYIHILMSLYRFLFIKSHEFALVIVFFFWPICIAFGILFPEQGSNPVPCSRGTES